jgi:hypothetical protein
MQSRNHGALEKALEIALAQELEEIQSRRE